MAFICKEISFGKTNIFFSLILVGAILLTSLTYVESLSKFFADINYHPVIYSMTYSLGLCLSFSFLIIYKIRNKSVKDNILPHNKDYQISRTFTGVSSTKTHMTFKEKFLWILLTSVINYIAYIFFCIYWMNETNFLNCWGITIIFMSLFSNLILKIKLYRHHYLSIIVVVLLGFSYNIVMDKFSKENIKKNCDSYLVQFMTECLISLMNVMYKFLIDTKYILSYEILVIEGIHCLNDKLTSQIPKENKYKVYISDLTVLNMDRLNRISTTDTRLVRRIVRDYQFRNYSAIHTLDTWTKVNRGEQKNIFPFQEEADSMFNTSLIYELAALKNIAISLLEKITKQQRQYAEANRLINLLKYFEPIPSEFIPANSLLKEFLGGGYFEY